MQSGNYNLSDESTEIKLFDAKTTEAIKFDSNDIFFILKKEKEKYFKSLGPTFLKYSNIS